MSGPTAPGMHWTTQGLTPFISAHLHNCQVTIDMTNYTQVAHDMAPINSSAAHPSPYDDSDLSLPEGKWVAPILETAPFPVLLLDTANLVLKANTCAKVLLQDPGSGLVGARLESLLAAPSYTSLRSGVESTLVFRGASGGQVHLLCRISPLKPEDPCGLMILVGIDLSRQRRTELMTEEIVRATEGLVGLAFERELVCRLAAAIGCRFLFVGEAERAKTQRISSVALCVDGAIVPDFSYDLENTPCAHVFGQAACYHPSGVQVEFPRDILLQQMGVESYYGAPLFDAAGEPIGIVVALHDKPLQDEPWIRTLFSIFSGRAGAELARMRAEQREQRLKEDLERARRLEALGTLAGGVAHDFNNLLTSILGNAELARLEAPPGSQLQQCLDELLQSVARGKAIVRDIFNFSGSAPLRVSTIELQKLLEEVVAESSTGCRERIRFEIRVDENASRLVADEGKLHQCLHNLVVNAVQAMPAQGCIRLSAMAGTLASEETGKVGACVILRVQDDGPGIPPEIRSRVFDPFFTTKQEKGGTGLGLCLVQRAVAAHGGVLTLDSTPGRGTTFSLYFPQES